ncbi:uncharacterized protein [Bemisia tabaci]|uniref:uncharacterized protein n=1 Tax=Bemisia tabaci TaxID=7038 RepID=UPI003B28D3E2
MSEQIGDDSDSEWFKPKSGPKRNDISTCAAVPSGQNYVCKFCSKTYHIRQSFLKHLKSRSCQKPPKPSENSKPKYYICSNCDVQIGERKNFMRHAIKCKGKDEAKYTKCLEPSCPILFYKTSELMKHLNEEHMQSINIEHHKFNSVDEFNSFKNEQNIKYFMSCVDHWGSRTIKGISYSYYICNHNVKDEKKRIKKHRIPGTFCPARMMVKTDQDGKCDVRYIKDHSHEIKAANLQYNRYSKDMLDYVKVLLIKGVSPRKIKLEVTKLCLEGEYPMKDSLLDLREIRNIHYRLLRDSHLHPSDAEAVGILASRFQKEGSLLWYKPQNVEKTVYGESVDHLEDPKSIFAFAFQNSQMRQELLAGAGRIVCIDSTLNTNRYRFYLLHVVVPDEYGVGFPCAYLISNSMNTEILTLFFSALNKRCPGLIVNALMTDDDKALVNAFCAVFGESIIHLLCKWHIIRCWKKHLSLISVEKLRNEVKDNLALLLVERNTQHFETMLKSFIDKYSKNKKTKAFMKYFTEYYSHRTEKWAFCFRNFPHANTDTNMYCESLHSTFKRYYLIDKVNSRLEDLISSCCQFADDKAFDLKKKRLFEKPLPDLDKPKNWKNSHQRGMQLPNDSVSIEGQGKWIVQSASRKNVHHTVTLSNETCCSPDHCYVQCKENECHGLCMHLYSCSCEDRNPLCKHIHKVHSLQVLSSHNSPNPDEAFDGECETESDELRLHSSPPKDLPPLELNTNVKFNREIIELLDDLKKDLFHDEVQKKSLPYLLNLLRQAKTVVKSVIAETVQLPCTPTMEFEKIAPNQKKTKQAVNLFRTIKTRKKNPEKSKFAFPTKEQRLTLKKSLLGLDASLKEEDIPDHIFSCWEDLTRDIFKFGENTNISILRLKSVPLNLPEGEVNKLKLITSNKFVLGWLEDEIIDAFLIISMEAFSNAMLIECWRSSSYLRLLKIFSNALLIFLVRNSSSYHVTQLQVIGYSCFVAFQLGLSIFWTQSIQI